MNEEKINTPSSPPIGGNIGQIVNLLGSRVSPRMRAAVATGLAAHSLKNLAISTYRVTRNKLMYTVSVPGSDPVYDSVHAWLLGNLKPVSKRSLLAETKDRYSNPYGDSTGSYLALLYDGTREHVVRIDGHRVTVQVERKDPPPLMEQANEIRGSGWMSRERIVFSTLTPAGRDAIIELLESLVVKSHTEEREPRLFVAQSWGDWNRRDEISLRPFDTVILRDRLAEEILEDLKSFRETEAAYSELGVPWHRGYLFYGPPGTGKTSIARALAGELGLDIYYLPLKDIGSDSTLVNLIGRVRPNSVLLLEDVDVVVPLRDDEKQDQVTLSGLLNTLDGVATPHGLITIMTTNIPDRLDEALVRPGRVDMKVEIGYMDADQLRRIVARFLPTEYARFLREAPWDLRADLTPSEVIDQLKKNIMDPKKALDGILETVVDKKKTQE